MESIILLLETVLETHTGSPLLAVPGILSEPLAVFEVATLLLQSTNLASTTHFSLHFVFSIHT